MFLGLLAGSFMSYIPVVEAEGEEGQEHGRGGGELVAPAPVARLHHQQAL